MIVYKLPDGIDLDTVRGLRGDSGSYLNPIQDIDGNWVITKEEVHSAEFNAFKVAYIDVIVGMDMIEFKPVIVTIEK